MTSSSQVLGDGFALANRRFGLIFLDMLWKALWLGITLGLVFLGLTWFGGRLQSITWESTGVRGLDTLIAGAVMRQFWEAHWRDLLGMSAVIAVASGLVWLVLEAYFRTLILAPEARQTIAQGLRPGLRSDARSASFGTFLISSVVKFAILSAATASLATIALGRYLYTPLGEWPQLWIETRGAVLIAAIILAYLSLIVAIFDTLLRSDAIDLLGRDLFGVSGVIASLMAFEALIAGTAGGALLAGLLNVSRMAELIAVAMFAVAAIVFLSFLHSYLLLVRFSAVDIMRRDVVQV